MHKARYLLCVGVLTKFLSAPGEAHWNVAVDVLSYLGGTKERGIVLGNFRAGKQGVLLGFADADWANDLDDKKSVSGGRCFLGAAF